MRNEGLDQPGEYASTPVPERSLRQAEIRVQAWEKKKTGEPDLRRIRRVKVAKESRRDSSSGAEKTTLRVSW